MQKLLMVLLPGFKEIMFHLYLKNFAEKLGAGKNVLWLIAVILIVNFALV